MNFNHRPGNVCRPFSRHALELWLRSPRGRRSLALEEQQIKQALAELFGRHIVQIGSWGRGDRLLAASEMLHRAVLGTVQNFNAQALIEPERLPVPGKTADAVLLPHTLEYSHSPHTVLREADRILTDRGRLLVLGFNPWSAWAWRQRLGFRYRAFPAGARFIRIGRLCDWLELLNFEVTDARRFGVGFPWVHPSGASASGLERWLGVWSESYLLVAKKRVIPVTGVGRVQRATVGPLISGVPVSGTHTRNP
ncbi:MAG: class I SAM-dependent methyltransferase [Nevskiales bacterium]|nr:class I SAM-dependent methyltransferase [Nevskiales bacterium]